MANNFAAIVPKIFAATLPSLRNAARACRVCRVDFKPEVAKSGDTIDFPVPVASSTAAVAPGVSPVANTDKVPTTTKLLLDQWRRSDKIALTAKEYSEIDAGDFRNSQLLEQTIALIEELNASVLSEAKNRSFRRVGTAATTPFGSGVAQQSSIDVRKNLQQGKAPMYDRHLLLDPSAEAAALGISAISDASLRGNSDAKLSGEIGQVFGLDHWGDQQVVSHVKGTAAGTLTHGTTIGAVGSASLFLKAGTTGTLKKGDLIAITTAGVVFNYVVAADVATVDTTAAGIAVAVFPPVQATHVSADVWTLVGNHVANIGMQRGAIGLGIRPVDPSTLGLGTHVQMTDPETGLSLMYSEIPEYMQVSCQVSILYGIKAVRDDWLVRLLG